jgi:hypothetical protein
MTQPPDRPVLPQQTEDDTELGWSEPGEGDDEQRLRDELPPHHVDRD